MVGVEEIIQIINGVLTGNALSYALFLILFVPGFALLFYFTKTKYGRKRTGLDLDVPDTYSLLFASILISGMLGASALIFAFGLTIFITLIFQVAFYHLFGIIDLNQSIITLIGMAFFAFAIFAYFEVFRYVFFKTKESRELLKSSFKVLVKSVGWAILLMMIGFLFNTARILTLPQVNTLQQVEGPFGILLTANIVMLLVSLVLQVVIIALVGVLIIQGDVVDWLSKRNAVGVDRKSVV